VNPQDAIPTLPAVDGAASTAPRAIELAIRGKDLLLAGKFEHWVPMALETGGKHGQAQLLFDVTSAGRANDADELFSFTSRDVRRAADGTFRAKGTLRQGDVEQASEAIVQVPAEHSPFAAVTFDVDEAIFPEVWSELSTRVAATGLNTDVRPQAWVLMPTVAAA
jgi:hypothetical protein